MVHGRSYTEISNDQVGWKPKQTISPSEQFITIVFWVTLTTFTFVFCFDIFLLPKEWCPYDESDFKEYANPDSKASDPCYYYRTPYLLGMSPFECDFGRRILSSVIFGALIGFERRAADRPAGIRTMSLVCLGAAVFTMSSQFAFRDSTMAFDAARVSAAVPSGVGFIGSALIWQQTRSDQRSVHGLTTAASVWLSASVGIGAGGALYLYCVWAVLLVVFILRLGPRLASWGSSDTSTATIDTNTDWETDAAKSMDDEDDEGEAPTRQQQLEQLRAEADMVKQLGLSVRRKQKTPNVVRFHN